MIPKNVQMPNPNPKYKPPGTPAGGRGGNLMEIEKLIERLQNWDGIKPDREIDCAIEGLKALQAENDRLRRERDAAVKDLNAIIGDMEEIRRRKYCRGRNEHGTVYQKD